MKVRALLLAVSAMCVCILSARAYDFSATVDGNRLCFNITDKDKGIARVTYSGSIKEKRIPALRGVVRIPEKVKHNGVIYRISEIGPKAFANESGIKEVIMPDGIESIRDFAFEGCDSLSRITFPKNKVKFGEGVFFRCTGIENVNLGSEWAEVNLTMFRWSDTLDSIAIPANIGEIRGLEKLKGLRSVKVATDNKHFSSHEGMLYDKSGKTLYRCPRGYIGTAKVAEGTEKVAEGALIDCVGITSLDLPASLKSISFRETSRMNGLERIIMRGEKPLINAFLGEEGRFLFMLANRNTTIEVPSLSLAEYNRDLASEAGDYSLVPGGLPYRVTAEELPVKKNLKGVKELN